MSLMSISTINRDNINFLLQTEWTGAEEDQDENHIWQDDWDDDTVEDDFSNQLRYC